MSPTSDPYLEARKAEILDGARAVFIRHGFERATMQDIATEVGISPGAIYRYFPSKEHLITVVCAAAGADGMRGFEQLEDGDSALDLLIEGGRQVWEDLMAGDALDGARMNLEATVAAMRHPDTIGASLNKEVTSICDQIAELVRHAQAQGSIDPDVDAMALANLLLSITAGTQALIVQRSGDVDVGAIWQLTVRMVRGLHPASIQGASPREGEST